MRSPFSLNLPGGRLVEFHRPAVMAILNATTDSFYRGARADSLESSAERAIAEGADIIDIGACSTRPGASVPSADEEKRLLLNALHTVRRMTDLPISVDTFRAGVAEAALGEGADIVNDVSGGQADPGMFPAVARIGAPYVMMHMRGTPQTMSQLTDYEADGGVVAAVMRFWAERLAQLEVNDVILDPGFGFAKTAEQNWELMRQLPLMGEAFPSRPLLVGISRKSMLYKPLSLGPEEVLPATVAANVLALQGGADILRVHDVAPARQAIAVVGLMAEK